MLACILEELPPEIKPKPDNYFYKRHRDHSGFKDPESMKTGEGDDSQQVSDAPPVRIEAPSRP